jgi:hypothetical protein
MTHFAWWCVEWTLFAVYGTVAVVLLCAWLGNFGVTFLRAVLWPLFALWAIVRAVTSS